MAGCESRALFRPRPGQRSRADRAEHLAVSSVGKPRCPRMMRSICAGVLVGAAALFSVARDGADRRAVRPARRVGKSQWSRSARTGAGGSPPASMQPSYIGMRGSEDLGGGLRAVYRLESYLRVDVGSGGGDGGDPFSGARGERRPVGTVRHDRARPQRRGRSGWRRPSSIRSANRAGSRPGCASTSAPRRHGRRHALEQLGLSTPTIRATRCACVFSVNCRRDDAEAMPEAAIQLRGSASAYITGPFAAAVVYERIRNSSRPLPAGFERQRVHAGRARRTTQDRARSTARPACRDRGRGRGRGRHLPARPRGAVRQQPDPGLLRELAVEGDCRRIHQQDLRRSATTFLSKNTDIYVAAMYEKADQPARRATPSPAASGMRF